MATVVGDPLVTQMSGVVEVLATFAAWLQISGLQGLHAVHRGLRFTAASGLRLVLPLWVPALFQVSALIQSLGRRWCRVRTSQQHHKVIKNLRRTFYPGQGQPQEAFKGLKVELGTAVKGVEVGLPTQPVDCNQNLKMGRPWWTYVEHTHVKAHDFPASQHGNQVKATFAPSF